MAVIIFTLGIKSVNGLTKSTINTANSLVKSGIDTTIIDIVGKVGGVDFLLPAFPLSSNVKRYTLDKLKVSCSDENELKKEEFHTTKQQYLTASYTMYHAKVLQEIDRRLSVNDLIIFVHPLAMKIYLKSNPNSKVKKMIQIHGNYLEEVANFELVREDFDEIDYIQTVSKYMKDDLINILHAPKDKTVYIPNIATPITINRKIQKNLKRISIVGSIQKRKNQFDAVKMLEYIENDKVILQIYGNALDREYTLFIKEYIENNGLSDRVVFKDVASEAEIYSNSDLIILTSEHEGLPYIFFEAAMYKLPVVAYDFKYGAKEFTRDNENGCLIKMGDYRAMAKRVNEIFNNEELYKKIVKENSEFFEEAYAEEKIVQKYKVLLGEDNKEVDFSDMSILEVDWIKEIGQDNIFKIGNNINCEGKLASIKVIGNNNKITIEENVSIRHSNITIKGNNISLYFGKNVELTGSIISLFQNTSLFIDENSTLGNGEITIAEENSITIGKDCMFAHGYEIRTSDMHPIYSLDSGKRINIGQDIMIGNHIWLGKNVTILKGAAIDNNSVVGINSIITKKFLEKNVVISGIPAKILKRNIVWGRKMYHQTMYDDSTLSQFINGYKEIIKTEIENRNLLEKVFRKVKKVLRWQ